MNEVKLSAEWRLYGAHDATYVARTAQPLLASSLQIGRLYILNLPGERASIFSCSPSAPRSVSSWP
jgi:hypothetical protein